VANYGLQVEASLFLGKPHDTCRSIAQVVSEFGFLVHKSFQLCFTTRF